MSTNIRSSQKKELGLFELIAIGVGGMIGGGFVAKVFGRKSVLNRDKLKEISPYAEVDSSRIRELTGWQPASFDQRVQETVDWWMAQNDHI